MKCPPVLISESERLQALAEYGLSSDQPLPSLDPVVQIAARMFNMPVSAVNMIGSDHVFFAASTGMEGVTVDMGRDVSFCAHAITQDEVLVVPDATRDERFHDNPLVRGAASVRFYAGAPLRSPDGHALGALCVIDNRPRPDFSAEDCARLAELARMASDRLELRRVEQYTRRASAAIDSADRDRQLLQLASTDPLTGLANRAQLYSLLERALAGPGAASVLMIDLDGFKDVNDTLGHVVGDAILCETGSRLRQIVPAEAIAARIGGDEFAVLWPGCSDPQQAAELAGYLIAAIAAPVSINDHEVRVGASCGVAAAPSHGEEPLELIGNADLALFKAKSIRRGQVFVFVQALRMEAVARRMYGIELHRAVAEGEFVLFYQPQVRLEDGSLCGAEALLRWRHPQRGVLSPAAFLPALEGGPLAALVGFWALDEACAQAAQWRRCGATDFRMGVNLFGAQFRIDNLVDEVRLALDRHGLPPEALELEVTENIALDHDEVALESLQKLRALGVGIAFDDFGTGYASLSLLKRYPLTRIKVDRSFVHNVLESGQDAAVVRAIMDMARSFGLETIAEGIEGEAQRQWLQQLGCQSGQGYLFGRPVPAEEFGRRFGLKQTMRVRALAG